jgi:alcohol dehydrogenase class IV
MDGEWRFHASPNILFGQGVVRRVGETARWYGAERVLLITDPGLVAAGVHERVEASLREAGITADRYEGGQAKPTLEAVAACVDVAREQEYDAFVSLGGGSNTDLAKAAAIVLRYGGPGAEVSAADYFGEHKVPGPVLPLIAVSTTAGTGAEVSGASVLSDPAHCRRGSIMSNHIRPLAAIYDPLLTVSCPPVVTADAGIDALAHAVEAYMAVSYRTYTGSDKVPGLYHGSFPLSDLLVEEAISLIGRYLRRAVYQGGDLEAREGMHLASLLAGMGFSNAGLTAVHALEYPVGVETGCTHGAGNGLFLPYVMEFNVPACPQRLANVARLLGEDVEGLPLLDAADRAVEAVLHLAEDIGIPTQLRDLGVEEEDLRSLAESTAEITRLIGLNPRPLDADALEGILRAAW